MKKCSESRSNASAPALARGTRCFRGLAPANRASMARFKTRSRVFRTSRQCILTFSTCRRSIRSGRRFARDRTTRSRQAPATLEALGRSAVPRGDTRRSTPNSARSRTSTSSSPPRSRSASNWPSTSRFSARPTTHTSANIRNGFGIVPTARSNMPRIRRKSIKTSIPSTLTATTGKRSTTNCVTSFFSGSTAECRSFGSITRTPSPSGSGSG